MRTGVNLVSAFVVDPRLDQAFAEHLVRKSEVVIDLERIFLRLCPSGLVGILTTGRAVKLQGFDPLAQPVG